jgi:hypothetical protein
MDVIMRFSQKMVMVDRVSPFGSFMAFVIESTSPDEDGKERVKVECIDEKMGKTIKHTALVSTPYWSAGIVYGSFGGLDYVKNLCIEALDHASITPKYEEKLEV